MIEGATLVVVIGMLRMRRRNSWFRAHRFRRCLGQTFVDNLVIRIAPPFLSDLSCDGWSWQFVLALEIYLKVNQLVEKFFECDW